MNQNKNMKFKEIIFSRKEAEALRRLIGKNSIRDLLQVDKVEGKVMTKLRLFLQKKTKDNW